ncbi:MAG: hypothetical protein HC824_07550 [Synechococcales cyanobacterium RM1_1_8]|nr:hypothetical protein [Synechococcales cyanobacterium RM1_1_8]
MSKTGSSIQIKVQTMAALRPWALAWIALILLLGFGFRLYGLDTKIYWHDEVFTSIRAAGYLNGDIVPRLLAGPITAAELLQFQQLSLQNPWADTWAALVAHPEHPPLFYLLERLWMGWFGSSIGATRGLSALFSIALFPLLAWLCHDLSQVVAVDRNQRDRSNSDRSNSDRSNSDRSNGSGGSSAGPVSRTGLPRLAAATGIVLLAASPVQVLYAQEAREYSLWACEIALASALLLRCWLLRGGCRAGGKWDHRSPLSTAYRSVATGWPIAWRSPSVSTARC